MAKDGMATATKIGAQTEENPVTPVTPEVTPDPATAPAQTPDTPAEVAPEAAPEPVTALAGLMTLERTKAIAKFIGLERWAKEARPAIQALLLKEDASIDEDEERFLIEAMLNTYSVQDLAEQTSRILSGRGKAEVLTLDVN